MKLGLPVLRAFWQRASEVVVREPGKRFLSSPRPIAPYAKQHWEFAWLSMAAYQKTRAGQKHAKQMRVSVRSLPKLAVPALLCSI